MKWVADVMRRSSLKRKSLSPGPVNFHEMDIQHKEAYNIDNIDVLCTCGH